MREFNIKELEEIFLESQVDTLEKLTKDFEKDGKNDSLATLIFSLQNTLAMAELKNTFFKKLESKD